MAVPYTFGSATTSIPLSQLDSNFATGITLGNTAIQLGNTVTTLNNMTLANVTISSGTSNVSSTSIANGTSNVTIASSGGAIAMATNGATAVTIDTSQNVSFVNTPKIGTTSISMVLLGSATASSSATVNFTSLPSSGYSAWIIQINDVLPATNAQNFLMRISTGSSFQSSSYWYTSRVYGTDGGAGSINNASDSQICINGLNSTLPNTGTVPFSTQLIIPNPSGTTNKKLVYGQGAYILTSGIYVYNTTGAGWNGGTTALDGLSFFMGSGNITAGTFYIYGVKNA